MVSRYVETVGAGFWHVNHAEHMNVFHQMRLGTREAFLQSQKGSLQQRLFAVVSKSGLYGERHRHRVDMEIRSVLRGLLRTSANGLILHPNIYK